MYVNKPKNAIISNIYTIGKIILFEENRRQICRDRIK